jgi:hypothetical protein
MVEMALTPISGGITTVEVLVIAAFTELFLSKASP